MNINRPVNFFYNVLPSYLAEIFDGKEAQIGAGPEGVPNHHLDHLIAQTFSETVIVYGAPLLPLWKNEAQNSMTMQSASLTITDCIYQIVGLATIARKRVYLFKQLKQLIAADLLIPNPTKLKEAVACINGDNQIQVLITAFEELLDEARRLKLSSRGTLLENILLRYAQLERTSFQKNPLTRQERLRLALYLEITLPTIVVLSKKLLFKADTGLEQVLQLNMREKKICITAMKDNSEMAVSGTYKEVLSGIEIDYNDRQSIPETIARAYLKSQLSVGEVQDTFKEIRFYERFKGAYGIVQLKWWCCFTQMHLKGKDKNFRCQSPSMVFQKYEQPLHFVHNWPNYFTLFEKIVISQDLIWGLWNMHKAGVIHGDLKLNNALVKQDTARKYAAALADFGFSFDHANNEAPNFVIGQGYYGSIDATAPELFGDQSFVGNYYKLDVWAMGVMLYELYKGHGTYWTQDIQNSYQNNFNNIKNKHCNGRALQAAQKRVKAQIESDIEVPFAALNRKAMLGLLTQKEEFEKLLYQMLRLHPSERVTIEQAKVEIDRIITLKD